MYFVIIKIEITLYDPRKLEGFAQQMLTNSENILIVGHSNTTPALVKLLGGDPHGSIAETEYDRLYQLIITKSKLTTRLLHSQVTITNEP